MYCHQCGKEIPDSSRFCLSCGKQLEEPVARSANVQAATPPPAPPEPRRTVASRPIGSLLAGALLAFMFIVASTFALVFVFGMDPVAFAEKRFSAHTYLFLWFLCPVGMGLVSLGLAIKSRGNVRCFMNGIAAVSLVVLSYRIYGFKKDIGSVLFLAASLGHEQTVRDLASLGAPIDEEITLGKWPDERSTTALKAALACDQLGIAAVLVAHGAGRKNLQALFVDSLDSADYRTFDANGWARSIPLWQCVFPAKEEKPTLRSRYRLALLKSGVSLSSLPAIPSRPGLREGLLASRESEGGPLTPLLMVVADGDIDTARWLTEHGADVNRGNPLEAAVGEPMVRMLLEHNVDPKLLRQAIERAVKKGHTRMVDLLKSHL